ncbi:MAG TPA: N-acetyltransferase [Rhodobacteraceae bacterium]|nr:N-acetyltransferase [Paracoccaceae bacterium]
MPITLRPLTQADLPALLNFERTNRSYFEQWVPPRPGWFFSEKIRYASHMATLLSEQKNGTFLMYVLVDSTDQILGRANLSVSDSAADLGYRIAQPHAGKGMATTAIQHICTLAKTRHSLSKITAQAASSNPASQRVLINNGFHQSHAPPQSTPLNGQTIWLESYQKRL